MNDSRTSASVILHGFVARFSQKHSHLPFFLRRTKSFHWGSVCVLLLSLERLTVLVRGLRGSSLVAELLRLRNHSDRVLSSQFVSTL
jgi:hypothetical protein